MGSSPIAPITCISPLLVDLKTAIVSLCHPNLTNTLAVNAQAVVDGFCGDKDHQSAEKSELCRRHSSGDSGDAAMRQDLATPKGPTLLRHSDRVTFNSEHTARLRTRFGPRRSVDGSVWVDIGGFTVEMENLGCCAWTARRNGCFVKMTERGDTRTKSIRGYGDMRGEEGAGAGCAIGAELGELEAIIPKSTLGFIPER